MRRWRTAAAGALVAAMLLIVGGGAAQAAHNCTARPSYEPSELLYHGTPVLRFDGGNHYPRGPAWLGHNREFSIHAALRHVERSEAPIRILAYRHRRPMTIVVCRNTAEFEQYAIAKGWPGRQPQEANVQLDKVLARFLCDADRLRVGTRLVKPHGYRMREDAVRREVEYIICNPAAILHLEASLQQPVLTMPVGDRRQWATRGPDGNFMLFGEHGMRCFVRLPEKPRATCPEHGTMPHRDCCKPHPTRRRQR